jgi:predicted aspartyl protease
MKHVSNAGSAADLVERGALFNVTLLPHPLVARDMAGQGTPIITANIALLLDTGADRTVVERQVAERMGLTPIRYAEMAGVNQQIDLYPVYLMTIRLGVTGSGKEGILDFNAEIIGMPSPQTPQPHAGLLGRDFLRGFYSTYNGGSGIADLTVLSEFTGGAGKKAKRRSAPKHVRHGRRAARVARKKTRRR